eukprot:5326143-Amphidinium_carterae.1
MSCFALVASFVFTRKRARTWLQTNMSEAFVKPHRCNASSKEQESCQFIPLQLRSKIAHYKTQTISR